jgi:hypothetical protein
MAPPDGSRGWICGHHQPDAEENRYHSCHMLPVVNATVTAKVPGVREMAAMYGK